MQGRFLQCAEEMLSLDRTRVMGVLNITADSFSDGGRFFNGARLDRGAVGAQAEAMVLAGAAIVDVGAESTRPGAVTVEAAIELDRVMPVVEIVLQLNTIVSVDTSKAVVAKAALEAGCHMINDVSGLADEDMLSVMQESGAALCLMHMQGTPSTMQDNPTYSDVVGEVHDYLQQRVTACLERGLNSNRLVTDPGFGFGKTLTHNLELLRDLESTRVEECPILVGLSRKGMIGTLTGRPVDERIHGSVAAALLAAERGADIVRVHDVDETVDALKLLEAVLP